MLRVGLQGSKNRAGEMTELIRQNDNCIVSGICTGINGHGTDLIPESGYAVTAIDQTQTIVTASDALIFLEHSSQTEALVKQCLKQSRHVFLNPAAPIKPSLLKEYNKLADEAGVIFYLFHKPELKELRKLLRKKKSSPEFIDIYRYAGSQNNSFETIRHALFHEMLFLHALLPYPVKKFKSTTVPYCSDTPFIINLRLEFTNGTTANLTLNTLTGIESRYSELYFSDSMIQVNTLKGNIREKFWDHPEPFNYELCNSIEQETDPSWDISEFLKTLSSLSPPINNYLYGHHIYTTFWELIKEITHNSSFSKNI